jgi:hypothetical protein
MFRHNNNKQTKSYFGGKISNLAASVCWMMMQKDLEGSDRGLIDALS